jgi:TrpR-related protein YerC/YecD
MRKVNKRDIDALYEAILTLKTLAEARRFFRDLLTQTEIEEFAERWKTARLLVSGVPYTRIVEETGISSTTVARVSRWVKKGTGGYKLALKRAGHRK